MKDASFWAKDSAPAGVPANVFVAAMVTEMNDLGRLFNEYYSAFMEATEETGAFIDVTLTVRFRLYGQDLEKQNAWDKDWRSKHPEWDKVSWVSVSSELPEIWGDLRRVGDELIVNPLCLGHEVEHELKLKIKEMFDVDKMTEI